MKIINKKKVKSEIGQITLKLIKFMKKLNIKLKKMKLQHS